MASPRFLTPCTILYIINIPGGRDEPVWLTEKCSKAKQTVKLWPLPAGENRGKHEMPHSFATPKNVQKLVL